MPRGGKRTGATGKSYGNRADLRGPGPLPVTTAPGQTYGEATQQAEDQAAVPMASGPAAAASPSGDPHADAQSFDPPPTIPLTAPSQRPDEHVMTPPAVQSAPTSPDPLLNGVALLNSLGDAVSPEVKALRAAVAATQANTGAP